MGPKMCIGLRQAKSKGKVDEERKKGEEEQEETEEEEEEGRRRWREEEMENGFTKSRVG